ncbi:MAG TPA: hypothetical protein VJ925_12990 [Longimicrobiales bacterium]|nr:hypothetical protein [Longimicrobiales bacterium]
MMIDAPRIRGFLLAGAFLFLGTPLHAQSLLSVDGFGFPQAGLTGRARALGGIGLGLGGARLSAVDPAGAADMIASSIAFTGSTSWVDVTQGDVSSDFSTTRFPMIALSYPAGSYGVVSVGFSTVLDQTWQDERASTVDIGGGGQAFVRDVFESTGGVSALEVGWARRFGRVAVGARGGRYTGSLRRSLTRVFDSVTVGSGVPPFQTGGRWDYSGFTGIVGASASIGTQTFVSGSIRLGGDLDATATETTDSPDESVSMPADMRVGASFLLAPDLVANAGFQFADWSETDATGQTSWRVGGGVEWTGSRILGKDGAWRLGAQRAQLPFAPGDAGDATETLFSAGLALELVQSDTGPLGWFDLTVEFGGRSFGDVQEDVLRSTLSVSLAGF